MPQTDSNITDPHPDFLTPLAIKILADRRESAYQQLVVRGTTPDNARNCSATSSHRIFSPFRSRRMTKRKPYSQDCGFGMMAWMKRTK